MFIVDVSYLVELEGKGNPRKREKYLMDAVNVTDSEVKITKYFEENKELGDESEFTILSSTLVPVSDIILEDFNEDTFKVFQGTAVCKDTKQKRSFIVGDENITKALKKTVEYFSTIPVNSIKETKLIFDSELIDKKTGELTH